VILTDPLKYPVSALLSQQITMLGTQWPALMALSLLTALPVIAIYLVLQRRVIDGLSTGAVK
jgi:ABC-type glycerol-3-phosphate transport system permease component